MDIFITGTTYAEGDEFTLGLTEVNKVSPHDHRWHRYQIIRVVRDDRPADFTRDMGLKDGYLGIGQIAIIGGVIDALTGHMELFHTVDELKDIAQQLREKPAFDTRELVKLQEVVKA